jgi:hypothetical protein
VKPVLVARASRHVAIQRRVPGAHPGVPVFLKAVLRLACALGLAGALALALSGALSISGASSPAAALQPGEPTPQTDASLPARDVTMIGATPEEVGAPGAYETWGVGVPGGSGAEGSGALLVRYTHEGGWSLGGELLGSTGQPLPAFKLDRSPLAGQMTPTGAGVLAGTVPGEEAGHPQQVLLVRNPGGAFQQTSEAPTLKEGEALFGSGRAPLIAALEEGGEQAGALVVPVS